MQAPLSPRTTRFLKSINFKEINLQFDIKTTRQMSSMKLIKWKRFRVHGSSKNYDWKAMCFVSFVLAAI